MATETLKACPASSPMLRLRGLHEARFRNHGINKTSCSSSRLSLLRPSELVVSIVSSSRVDAIRVQNAQRIPACFKLAPSKKQTSRLKVQIAQARVGLLLSSTRNLDVSVAATAGPEQTFPSQNGGGEKSLPVKPDPAVEPGEVVQAQLKALRERDLATVYEFASPANKSHTGPLPRFTQMLEGRAYNMMIGHTDALVLSSMTISPNRFQQRIVITGASGKRATFSWALSKQEEGPFEGCWMTDTVRRDDYM